MTYKKTILNHYRNIVKQASLQLKNTQMPKEGWVATLRKALGISGAQLARRLNVSRASVSQAEKKEITGNITINHLQKMAKALDSRLVYAIIPNKDIKSTIQKQANKKATDLVRKTSQHMALENQSLNQAKIQEQIKQLEEELIKDMPSDFWDK